MRIDIENRTRNDPKTLGIAEHLNSQLEIVLERLFEVKLPHLHPQEKANIAAFEWNNSLKTILGVCPNEFAFGQRLNLSTLHLYGSEDASEHPKRVNWNKLTITEMYKLPNESDYARRKRTLYIADKEYVKGLQSYLPAINDWVYILKDANKWSKDKTRIHKSNRPWEGPYQVITPGKHTTTISNGAKNFAWPNNRLRLFRSRGLTRIT